MLHLRKGRYLARVAADPQDLARAYALRAQCFGSPRFAETAKVLDQDVFDQHCTHVLIEDIASDALVCCFRVLPLVAAEISQSYSAQFYDLSALSVYHGPLLELGRFCIHPEHPDPDILRMAWGFLTRWVDEQGVQLLFGCASFPGDEAVAHLDAFGQLFARHLAPKRWRPQPKAAEVFDFAKELAHHQLARNVAQTSIPPLLRTYLLMGGWVSDHAVFDRVLQTMHVFTGVEIGAIPPARARLLRALADNTAGATADEAAG